MLRFKEFLKETLTARQRRWVDSNSPYTHPSTDYHRDLFENLPEGATKIDQDRFTIPLEPVDKSREEHITSLLEPHGVKIHDYINNKAIDTHGRITSIAKILAKNGHDPNLYASDPRVRARNNGEISGDTHEILISRHRYDIAGASTGRDWDSCMTLPGDPRNLEGGRYYKKIKSDMQHGTLAAYLIPKGSAKPEQELTKDQALSRILIKRFKGTLGDNIFRAEKNSYSPAPTRSSREKYPKFEQTVKNFAENQWKPKNSPIYIKNTELYDDDKINEVKGKYFQDFTDEDLNSYYTHLKSEIKRILYDYKDPEDMYDGVDILNNKIIQIAKHPNASSDLLHHIAPAKYDTEDSTEDSGGHFMPYERTRDNLIRAIAEHPNVSHDTLSFLHDEYDDNDDVKQNLIFHKDTPDHELAGFVGENGIWDRSIAEHPNAGKQSLRALYHGRVHFKDSEILKNIVSNKHSVELHDEMLDDIENDRHAKLSANVLLQGLAKHSTDPHILHRIYKFLDVNSSDNHDIIKNLTKNKSTETDTLQNIHDEMAQNPDSSEEYNKRRNEIMNNISSHKNTPLSTLQDINSQNRFMTSKAIAANRLKTKRVYKLL